MVNMESNKNQIRRSSCSNTVNSRKHSLTAQLSRTARHFSVALAPQLTKLDPLPLLQNYEMLNIRLANAIQLQAAVQRYIIKNSVNFSPIDFEITDANDIRVLSISLHPEEMILSEGARKIFSITFDDSDPDECGTVIAKIRHPISGMRIFEFLKLPCSNIVQILSHVDRFDRCQIKLVSNSIFNSFAICNCFFARTKWQFTKEDKIYAFIRSNGTFFDENSLRLEWIPQADNELRLIVIAYGMTQMVHEDCDKGIIKLEKQKKNRKFDISINKPIAFIARCRLIRNLSAKCKFNINHYRP